MAEHILERPPPEEYDDKAAVDALCGRIDRADRTAARLAKVRQLARARPADSLGRLDAAVLRIAGILRRPSPGEVSAAVSVLAGDHGVAAHGTSVFQPTVTGQVLELIAAGKAPVNILAARLPAPVEYADFGLLRPVGDQRYKVAAGTRDITRQDAMTVAQAWRGVCHGMAYADAHLAGVDLVAVGEIGVGNTTATAALAARLLDLPASGLTGRGVGAPDSMVRHKTALIEQALARVRGLPGDPVTLLAALGGFEIAGNVGVILAAAARRQIVLIDGTITAVAALLAVRLCPAVGDYLIAAHLSTEPAHQLLLGALDQPPLLQLDMRLGMASGAALAVGLINAALAVADGTPAAEIVDLAEAP
ncbi:nicotinate-nucleotide--dimethylbenzimidazole phosphoribosyltransferase [Streptomyces sp. NPDC057620]|uniref:nicotinate-nucleotide--dimethylbenzimidazole phosphoribosyltransferase n=1 Tax=Streptomyces sp. NPDC057620 TaxID=3346185 RepID=UPI0036CF3000